MCFVLRVKCYSQAQCIEDDLFGYSNYFRLQNFLGIGIVNKCHDLAVGNVPVGLDCLRIALFDNIASRQLSIVGLDLLAKNSIEAGAKDMVAHTLDFHQRRHNTSASVWLDYVLLPDLG